MKTHCIILVIAACISLNVRGSMRRESSDVVVSGEMRVWHKITVTFTGPQTGENSRPNPFTDYRLNVTFSNRNKQHVVPGYYAADGNAAESGATEGNKWRVHFVPDEPGRWTYIASFRTGPDIAIANEPTAGAPVAFDGMRGSLMIGPSDKKPPDFRAKGFLRYVGKRYLQFAGATEYFIKGGADSPENFLAYADFDGTYDSGELKRDGEAAGEKFLHRYEPHLRDFTTGDPTWQNGKGKGIIGALNYLASKGMNSIYFLTYNIDGGDGKDVWPWTTPTEKSRFDCSKLDQWEIVFCHADKLGIMLHVITQEQENDQGLDGGELGPQRKLYYRELTARFAHHLALVWNLGEENTNTDAQRKAFARYIRELDPYDHPIVVHTYPGQYDQVYEPLLGYEYFEGVSLQTNDTHAQTLKWVQTSGAKGRQWIACLDEIGPAHTGVKPDANDYGHDEVRKKHLWGNLMAGGAGVEWYFGYNYANNDLNCEDWRSRDHLWDLTRYALEFFRRHVPFICLSPHDELTSAQGDYCLAAPGAVYVIYLPDGGTTNLDMGGDDSAFDVLWYNPRTGEGLVPGSVNQIKGPASVGIGQAPSEPDKDWAVLIKRH